MKIWDLPTRIYHWLQALLFIGLAASGFNGEGPHIYLGLVLFTLIMWRIVWGFVGSDTSRFKKFIASPKRTIRYLLGKEPSKAGHNPAGSWMVIGLIFTLFIQCITGIALAGLFDHIPYSDIVLNKDVFDVFVTLHGICARLLPTLVILHLIAILFYKLRSKPLVWAMISGVQKKLTEHQTSSNLMFVSNKRALLVLIATGLVTIAIVVSAGV
ncbi:hydrogenase [Aliivibrio finisterrensis]|uniref:cytochrome b/b6 domain-containing protein n=1 Tax=Aliivibrio finisterrensis TaxID=511998 RepID=UPI00101F1DBF|nr:cytochrome b/b6 domain-containing protein [Aliivibrio finisterrensis]RYU68263.1 hydrogenase [Aliivibrio finisterrensis]RYU71962.1 hydrogenase [Aliivibrio finisterrensis]RYU75571.1 hydrogenase [Aliivibrio finisterrensis]